MFVVRWRCWCVVVVVFLCFWCCGVSCVCCLSLVVGRWLVVVGCWLCLLNVFVVVEVGRLAFGVLVFGVLVFW